MKIGKLIIPPKVPLALAPMAGYTNVAMREMMADMGADIVYSELASAAALAKEYKTSSGESAMTQQIIRSTKKGVNGIQLFGSNSEEISGAIKFIEQKIESGENRAKFIDLNLGCPASKVVSVGAGCELVKDMTNLGKIVSCATKSSLPITVKMRLMPKLDDSIKLAKMLERRGIGALAIHGRTQKQKYRGDANWGAIRNIAQKVGIAVFGNGDVCSAQAALKMLRIASCEGVMVGRACLQNPFIFIQIRDALRGHPPRQFSFEDKVDYLKKYFSYCEQYEISFVEAKELSVQLVGGAKNARKVRDGMVRSNTYEELLERFWEIKKN